MSSLDDLVPPLELCKKIPDGKFADSVFVWTYSCDKNKTAPYLEDRDCIDFCRRDVVNAPPVYPAPTLQEILQSLPAKGEYNCLLCCQTAIYDDGEEPAKEWEVGYTRYYSCSDVNPAAAGLKFWMKFNNQKRNG